MTVDNYINHLIQFAKNDVPFVIVFAIFLLLARTLFSTRKKFAPGPYGLPILGYLPFLGKNPHFTVDKLSKTYGGIYGFYLGSRYVVVLSSYEALKEGFAKTEFLGRPNAFFKCVKAERAVVSINGKEWEEQRKFMLHLLKDLGFGKSKMEEYVKEEIGYFLECVEKEDEKPFEFKNILVRSVSNNISSFVFGKRMEYDDPHKIALDTNLSQFVALIGQVSAPVFFPWVLPIIRKLNLTFYVKFMDSIDNFHIAIRDEISQHKATINYGDIRDFTDGYLLKMKEKNEQNKSTSFDDEMLFGNVRTLFAAGTDTVKTAIDWSFLILASFKECQMRIQDEIEKVTRKERTVCWADRIQMPYTQAFISEVLRWRTITPLSVMRQCIADTTIQGFHVPKDTFILANIWSLHTNPEYWNEPEVFHPERFMKEYQTKLDSNNEAYAPFTLGKRSCPGKIFALLQIFLYVTSVLERYTVCLPESEKHDFLGEFGQSYQPKPWKVYLMKRT